MQFIYCKESINLYKSIGLLAFCKYADRQTDRRKDRRMDRDEGRQKNKENLVGIYFGTEANWSVG